MSLECFDSIDQVEFEDLLNDFLSNDESGSTSGDENNSFSTCSTDTSLVPFSCSSNDSNFKFQKMKNKRIRKYTYIPVLRVLKRDVRRSYADMFTNVWNSADFPLLFGFLDTYFLSNFQQQSFKPHHKDSRHCRETQGVVSVAKFWYTTMLLAPDLTMKLTGAKVVCSEDTRLNRVDARFHMTGTRVFYVPDDMQTIMQTMPTTDEEKVLYDDGRVGLKRVNEETARLSIVDSIMSSVQRLVDPFPLSMNPIKMDVEGTFTMFTDEDNRVSRMVMEMSQNKNSREGGGSFCVQGYNARVQGHAVDDTSR